MDMATQQNAALVEEATAASETLFSQAKELLKAMEFFKLKGEDNNVSKKIEKKENKDEKKEHKKINEEKKELDREIKEDYTDNLDKEYKEKGKEEEKKVFTPRPKPSTEIKSPIKKSYEETKPVISTSKDSEFGSTFNNSKSDSEGFESF